MKRILFHIAIAVSLIALPSLASATCLDPCTGNACCCAQPANDHHGRPIPTSGEPCPCSKTPLNNCHLETKAPLAQAVVSAIGNRTGEPAPTPFLAVAATTHIDLTGIHPGPADLAPHTDLNPPPRYLLVCAFII